MSDGEDSLFVRSANSARLSEAADDEGGRRQRGRDERPTVPARDERPVAATWAKGPLAPDRRKFRYDVHRAASTRVEIGVTRDDRMSAEEAGNALHAIHVMFGLDRASEARIAGFDKALFFCHTVNSGSTLQPGATKLTVDGMEFDFGEVVRKLGNGIRRFFRAFADDVAEVNKAIIDEYDPYDPVTVDRYGWLVQIAIERGLQRYPHLAHDSADACVRLTPAERAAVVASKRAVLSSTVNAVDSMQANPRVLSANKFDSTNRTTV